MRQITFIYIVVRQQKWNNAYLETTFILEGRDIATSVFKIKSERKLEFLSSF